MNSDIKEKLFNLSEQSARELERYVKIYDLKFDRTNFVDIYEAKMKRTDEILSSYDSLISTLEILARDLEKKTIEYDYNYSLGNYICEIINTINTYQHRLRIIKHHQINGNKFNGILSLLKNNREHKKHQKAYLNHGANLTALWGIMKNT